MSGRATKPHEEGFVLLYIFLLAALIAIGMYAVLPRVAFESERDQELLLVDRGNEYKRGIQLYFRKLHTYPAKMEDLDNTNGIRFIRRRYKDPLTNSDEWRLIHVGPGGVFVDSLIQKNKTNASSNTASVNNSVTELKPIADGSTSGPNNDVNVALRRRPSDGGPGEGVDPNAPLDPNNPLPPLPGSTPSGGSSPNPGDANNGSNAPINGFGGSTVGQNNQNPNGLNGNQNPAAGGQPGFPPGGSGGAAQIQRLLTTPNPNAASFGSGGAVGILGAGNSAPGSSGFGAPAPGSSLNVSTTSNGTNGTGNSFGTPVQGTTNGTVVGGGIAGVASKVKRTGIMLINDRKKINEWEFTYDYSKELAAAAGFPQPANNNNGTPLTGSPGNSPGTGAGSQSPTSGLTPGSTTPPASSTNTPQ